VTSWILVGAAGLLGALLIWGLVSPRTQWRVLVGWSTSDPDRAEPGDGVHGVTRLLCLLGLLGLLAIGGFQLWSTVAHQPRSAPERTALERMWGDPVPGLLDRVVTPAAAPPVELAAGTISGIQDIDRGSAPDYLVGMPRWEFLGEPVPLGVLGGYPGDGFTAYGISDVLVAAEGPLGCIPRGAAVAETDGVIEIGVYWGLPGAGAQDHVGACSTVDGLRQTVLVPIQLAAPLDGRDVVTFEGDPVPPVPVLED
jgi:hypothetical protein